MIPTKTYEILTALEADMLEARKKMQEAAQVIRVETARVRKMEKMARELRDILGLPQLPRGSVQAVPPKPEVGAGVLVVDEGGERIPEPVEGANGRKRCPFCPYSSERGNLVAIHVKYKHPEKWAGPGTVVPA